MHEDKPRSSEELLVINVGRVIIEKEHIVKLVFLVRLELDAFHNLILFLMMSIIHPSIFIF